MNKCKNYLLLERERGRERGPISIVRFATINLTSETLSLSSGFSFPCKDFRHASSDIASGMHCPIVKQNYPFSSI